VQAANATLEEAILRSRLLLDGVAPTAEQAYAIGRGYWTLVVGFDWSKRRNEIRTDPGKPKPVQRFNAKCERTPKEFPRHDNRTRSMQNSPSSYTA
jgi:hypothetical protein